MKLSDFQKNILDSILAAKCTTIDSFLKEFGELTQQRSKGNSFVGHTSFDNDSPIFVPKNRELTLIRLKEYVSLWDRLQKMGLVYTVSLDLQSKSLLPLFKSVSSPDDEMLSIIRDHLKKEILPLPDLNEFVLRGHQTTEEYFLHEENRDRKKAQRLTLIIAVISIAATFISAIFQYFTYTTDRNVVIKNEHAFSDTTRVIIINNKQLHKDTLHIQNNQSKIKLK